MWIIVFLVIAFALGSVPFSFIIAKRVRGIDLREHGSGNLGATNVFRNLGPWWGSLCLFLDMAKGAGAVLLMTALVASWPETDATPFHITPDLFRIFAGLLASLGHTFSPFVGFHGGKGVATTAGGIAVLEPYGVLAATVVFLAVLGSTRIVSLASICAASILPFAVIFFEFRSLQTSKTLIVVTFLVCTWVVFKHRTNIARLRDGTETRIDSDGSGEKLPTIDGD
ncbi:MAG: glycerol-3-phosphate 1-O-acyltransferase PlsY [bacterium]|nr:glycerol-3-phosphate 1-O-acyltransferase PlsY [bacterium]